MTTELTTLIGVLCTMIGAAGTYAAMRRASHKDAMDEGRSGGTMLTEIGYIKSGVDDIKRKQELSDAKHHDMAVIMTRVEASTKSAHNRLDDHLRYEHHQNIEKRGKDE